MNVEPNDLLLFARVIEAGSFSRAAERARLPKSTLSRRIAALEAQFGERLLLRTTRKLTLTDFGQAVLDHAKVLADEVDETLALALHRQAEPSGRLRVSMLTDLAEGLLAPMLAAFLERHPRVQLELDLSARRVDLVGEGFDLALRAGALADDATLAARRLATMSVGLYASPHHLALHGEPQTPAALLDAEGLLLPGRDGEPQMWTLERDAPAPDAGRERWDGRPRLRALVNSSTALLQLAVAGLGIAGIPVWRAREAVERGTLVRVLPGWCLPPIRLSAVFPGRRLMPTKTRLFIGELERALAAVE